MTSVGNAFARVAIAGTMTVLAACGEAESAPTGGNGTIIEPAINEIVVTPAINASANDTLVYYSLASNTVVPRSGQWDIALRRYEVRLNGGVSGTAGVTGLSLGNNRSATSAQVLGFTLENTRAAFDSIRAAQVPADSLFRADRLIANTTAYLNLGGVPTANAAAYWKVRTANGGFAVVRVTGITISPQFALTSISLETRVQSGTTLGAPRAVTIPVGTAPVTISVATGAAVTPNGCNWDLQLVPQSFFMTVNTACNVGTYPGEPTPAFAAVTTASDAPQYGAFLSGLTGPVPNSITDLEAPFRYNLLGTNRLDPAFNTYLIKSGARVYKVQLVGYYSAAGAGGFPTLRYARIR
jgi:hypothetical protein